MLRGVRRLRSPTPAGGWEYRPEGWQETAEGLRGWDAPGVSDAQAANWETFLAVIAGTGPLGVNHTDLRPDGENPVMHNLVMTFAYALCRARGEASAVSLLDWGGGVGHYYRLARALVPEVRLDYTCRDVPSLCRRGRELNPGAGFCESDSEAWGRTYDLVLASGSLHYSRDWRATLRGLAGATGNLLLVTRLPLVAQHPSFVVVQRAYDCGYGTEYQGWFLNRAEFLAAAAETGLRLERELVVEERPVVPGAPEQCAYRGFLFSRAQSAAGG